MKKFAILATTLLTMAGGLFADTIAGTSTGVFNNFTFNPAQTSPLSTDPQGTPFWNNFSYKVGTGANPQDMNIGYLLTHSGGYATSTAVLGSDTVSMQYTATNAAPFADPTAFNFVQNATSYNITLIAANSSQNAHATFGWYDVVSGTPVLHQIYGPGSGPVGNVPGGGQGFAPVLDVGNTGQYGFYTIECYQFVNGNCGSTETFFTNSALNAGTQSSAAGWNHFALFNLNSNAQSYVIGFEDTLVSTGAEHQGDFADFVVELSVNAVPEPATLSIVGLSLVGLALAGRRRSRQ